jgi:16S rRNA (adenine1518-N6/adenine1519-N6)-dimethyltransferase
VNVKGEIFLHQRSERKDLYPGYWNSSASGHLDLGESYDGAATRELGEELPNVSSSLKKVGSFKTRDSIESENSMLYVARHDGEVQFNRDEVAGGRFISVAELRGDIAEGRRKFTPGFLAAFKLYCEAKGV